MNQQTVLYRARRRRARRGRLLFALISAVLAAFLLFFLIKGISGDTFRFLSDESIPPQDNVTLPQASGQSSSDLLLLVNPWHSVPEDYAVELVDLKNGQAVDARCYDALQKMMDDCRSAGLSPVICSSYRTLEKQQALYDGQVDKLLAQGYSRQDAEAEAAAVVAVPGISEHHLGLAVDIVDLENQNLDESQEDTPVQQWMLEHCWEYGFILRYPGEKSDKTGIVYEPWHYRYVGKEAAEAIHRQGICLEEYLERL